MITRYKVEIDFSYPEITCDVARVHRGRVEGPAFRSEPDTSNRECEDQAAAAGWLVLTIDGEQVHFCPECNRVVTSKPEPVVVAIDYFIVTSTYNIEFLVDILTPQSGPLTPCWSTLDRRAIHFADEASAIQAIRSMKTSRDCSVVGVNETRRVTTAVVTSAGYVDIRGIPAERNA